LILEHEVGMRVLPVGGGFERFARCSRDEFSRLEAGFAGLSGAVDTVLIDTESSDDPANLPLGLARADILVVVTPEADAIKDAYTLVKRLVQRFGKRQFQLLVNRAASPAHAERVAANFASAARRFLDARVECVGAIPEDLRIQDSDILQQSVVEAFPVAASAPHFRRLAERLAGGTRADAVPDLSVLMQRVLQGSRLLSSHARG
jgi:flagellar biosynthesis protein FlhG